ncbi:hypothetical protein D3C81_2009350 [compost metagenome]
MLVVLLELIDKFGTAFGSQQAIASFMDIEGRWILAEIVAIELFFVPIGIPVHIN